MNDDENSEIEKPLLDFKKIKRDFKNLKYFWFSVLLLIVGIFYFSFTQNVFILAIALVNFISYVMFKYIK